VVSKSDAIKIATQRPERFPRASMGTLTWITLVWVLLWGDVTPGNIVAGFVIALAITTISPFPAGTFDGRFRPKALAILVVDFLRDLIVAAAQQAWFIVRGRNPHSAIVRVNLRSRSDAYLAMTAGMSGLIPGSIVVEADAESGTVYVHVFDVDLAGGLDAAHDSVLDLEERILRAFATRNELLQAGFVPGPSRKSGRLPVPLARGFKVPED
jgi:multicomponent Na+:H+ antiporter subunit E